MKHNTNYFGSSEHLQNFAKAQQHAVEWHRQAKIDRIKKYHDNPKHCLECDGKIDYDKQINRFCSRSCSCTFNNRKRLDSDKPFHSEETKRKISKARKGIPSPMKGKTYDKVKFKSQYTGICKTCKVEFTSHKKRKTCSRKCQIIASTQNRSYQNGSRKAFWYYNPYEQKNVLLESSWEKEIAEYLIACGIVWVRPSPISWVDKENKSRLYYPDFFLPEHNIYLDPKNPYCMKQDIEKMANISKQVVLYYGSLNHIKDIIKSL